MEPESRAALRKQYTANEIIPRDVRRRLLAAYYLGAPRQIFGAEELSKGPLITFGMGLVSDDKGVSEISRAFKTPSRLIDVWLLPLGLALRRWQRRTRKQPHQRQFGEVHWRGHLAVPTDFNIVQEENFELLLRDGGAQVTWFERALILRELPLREGRPPRGQPTDADRLHRATGFQGRQSDRVRHAQRFRRRAQRSRRLPQLRACGAEHSRRKR